MFDIAFIAEGFLLWFGLEETFIGTGFFARSTVSVIENLFLSDIWDRGPTGVKWKSLE